MVDNSGILTIFNSWKRVTWIWWKFSVIERPGKSCKSSSRGKLRILQCPQNRVIRDKGQRETCVLNVDGIHSIWSNQHSQCDELDRLQLIILFTWYNLIDLFWSTISLTQLIWLNSSTWAITIISMRLTYIGSSHLGVLFLMDFIWWTLFD